MIFCMYVFSDASFYAPFVSRCGSLPRPFPEGAIPLPVSQKEPFPIAPVRQLPVTGDPNDYKPVTMNLSLLYHKNERMQPKNGSCLPLTGNIVQTHKDFTSSLTIICANHRGNCRYFGIWIIFCTIKWRKISCKE